MKHTKEIRVGDRVKALRGKYGQMQPLSNVVGCVGTVVQEMHDGAGAYFLVEFELPSLFRITDAIDADCLAVYQNGADRPHHKESSRV